MTTSPETSVSTRPMVIHARCVTGYGGGPEKTILNSPRFLEPLGYDSICAYLHPPSDPGFATLEARASAARAPLVSIPDRGPWDWKVITRLIRLCRERKAAIWHGHDYKSNVAGLVLRAFWPMRLVTTVHGWVDQTKRMPLYDKIDRWALRYYREVMCVSEDLHQQCLALGISADHCHLIRNGIDTEDFRRDISVADAKHSLEAAPNRLLVGAVGRLAAEKGFDLLIQAVCRLIDQGLPVDLWIAGEGGERAALEQQIQASGKSTHLRLLGQITDPRRFFQACDVFALSSHREGLPNVVLEAMALEVPVVATRIAGVPKVIEHERSGLLIEPGSVDQLEQALRRMLEHPEFRRDLALAARCTIEESYSFADRMRKEVAIYDRVLGRSPTPRPGAASCEQATATI